MKRRRIQVYGFTLIELMMVSAIIGLLAAIAVPKFGNLIIKAKEAQVKGRLGAFRSAIHIYYADNVGTLPQFSGDGALYCLVPKYMDALPVIAIPQASEHGSGFKDVGAGFPMDFVFTPWEGRAWCYNSISGTLVINCTHLDSIGRQWSTW